MKLSPKLLVALMAAASFAMTPAVSHAGEKGKQKRAEMMMKKDAKKGEMAAHKEEMKAKKEAKKAEKEMKKAAKKAEKAEKKAEMKAKKKALADDD